MKPRCSPDCWPDDHTAECIRRQWALAPWYEHLPRWMFWGALALAVVVVGLWWVGLIGLDSCPLYFCAP